MQRFAVTHVKPHVLLRQRQQVEVAVAVEQRQQRSEVEAVARDGELAKRLAGLEVVRHAGREEERQSVAGVLPEGGVAHQLAAGGEQLLDAAVAARHQLLLGLAKEVLEARAVLEALRRRAHRRHVYGDAGRPGIPQRTQVLACE
ncbi:MAG TPA: hypothetical protein VN811_10395 [Thermoanaerobaculia bacterium]|nr:hypothetical protein [Thermoanaerobaculia bacterium]